MAYSLALPNCQGSPTVINLSIRISSDPQVGSQNVAPSRARDKPRSLPSPQSKGSKSLGSCDLKDGNLVKSHILLGHLQSPIVISDDEEDEREKSKAASGSDDNDMELSGGHQHSPILILDSDEERPSAIDDGTAVDDPVFQPLTLEGQARENALNVWKKSPGHQQQKIAELAQDDQMRAVGIEEVQELIPDDFVTLNDPMPEVTLGHQSREVTPDDPMPEVTLGHQSREVTPDDLVPDDLNSEMYSGQKSSSLKNEADIDNEDEGSDSEDNNRDSSQDFDYIQPETALTAEDSEEEFEGNDESASDCDSERQPSTHFARLEQPDDDEECLFCEDCFGGNCPSHGPLKPLEFSGQDQASLAHSIPSPFTIKPSSSNTDIGLGVYATQFIPKRVQLGPYKGKRVDKQGLKKIKSSAFKLMIWHEGEIVGGVDASDPAQSNWLKYVNHARSKKEQNLTAFQYKEDIYFCTSKDISPGTELLVQFSSQNIIAKAQGDSSGTSCLRCGCMFVSKKLLWLHLNRTKCAAKPPKPTCGKCHWQFSQLAALRQHIKKHIEKDGYCVGNRCEFCKEYFDRRSGLQEHLKAHVGVQSFKCVHCGRSFCYKGSFERHVQTKHKSSEYKRSEDWPYKCEQCEKRFLLKKNLQRHVKIHSGEKPHKCDVCGISFRRRMHLRRHIETRFGSKPLQCKVCKKKFCHQFHLRMHKCCCAS